MAPLTQVYLPRLMHECSAYMFNTDERNYSVLYLLVATVRMKQECSKNTHTGVCSEVHFAEPARIVVWTDSLPFRLPGKIVEFKSTAVFKQANPAKDLGTLTVILDADKDGVQKHSKLAQRPHFGYTINYSGAASPHHHDSWLIFPATVSVNADA